MAGGGGSSGSVVYPDHMLAVHHYLLTGGIYPGGGKWYTSLTGEEGNTDEPVDTAVGLVHKIRDTVNPYIGINSYRPDTHITKLEAIADAYEASIDASSVESENEQVNNYEFDARHELNQNLNQVAGRFYEINAVAGSQFDTFNSILLSRHLRDINRFRQTIKQDNQYKILEHEANLASIRMEIEKISVSLKIEEYNTDIDFNQKEATWDLELYREAGNILGSIAGSATPTSREKNRVGSSIAGAIGGGAAGAFLFGKGGALAGGAIGGPAGIVLGGILGGIGGLLG